MDVGPQLIFYFFHFVGLTKKIGRFKAAHIPFIEPKVCPKLNMLVTPCPGIALTCSTIKKVSPFEIIFFLIIFTN